MKYKVDGWNNFCWVFELPPRFPEVYCFGGGPLVGFRMVDWFYPVTGIDQPAVSKKIWREKVGEIEVKEIDIDELSEKLIPWLREKEYVKPEREYLVLCDFGAAIRFKK